MWAKSLRASSDKERSRSWKSARAAALASSAANPHTRAKRSIAGEGSLLSSVGFNMQPPFPQKLRFEFVPVQVVRAGYIAKRLNDASLHAFQTANIDVGVVVSKHLRHAI